ncbi:MAG: TIGR03086 family protein [Actinobacteria bacterium]|nr:TIGR03086 family protein [Actinomycetota bacterium]
MDLIAALDEAGNEFGRLVDGTRPEQLGDETPCTEFTVRDLVNHLVGGATMFAIAFEQGSVPDDELAAIMGDMVGDDPSAAYATASARVQAAYHAPGALDGMVTMPFGEMPREAALGIASLRRRRARVGPRPGHGAGVDAVGGSRRGDPRPRSGHGARPVPRGDVRRGDHHRGDGAGLGPRRRLLRPPALSPRPVLASPAHRPDARGTPERSAEVGIEQSLVLPEPGRVTPQPPG